jgi:DegV family protein with EDD domain
MVVTDSTAMLPADLIASYGIEVVPTTIVIGGEAFPENEVSSASLVESLTAKRVVSTSRPSPAAFAETYQRLADAGATSIVSVHLSSEMSGTIESARLAAAGSPVPVVVVDTQAVGPCLGLATLTAADAVAGGADAETAAARAMDRANAAKSIFYVATLEYLRASGRVGGAAALLGSALAVKPLLEIVDGVVVPRERVRTASRALAKIADIAVEAAGEHQVDIVVAHLQDEATAQRLSTELAARLGSQLADRPIATWELGAVLGAHVGPGMVAVCVAPRA